MALNAARQIDSKSRPPYQGSLLHFDPALMLLDDPINRGQPQASAFPNFFGGKKRVSKIRRRFLGGNTASGVFQRRGTRNGPNELHDADQRGRAIPPPER